MKRKKVIDKLTIKSRDYLLHHEDKVHLMNCMQGSQMTKDKTKYDRKNKSWKKEMNY